MVMEHGSASGFLRITDALRAGIVAGHGAQSATPAIAPGGKAPQGAR